MKCRLLNLLTLLSLVLCVASLVLLTRSRRSADELTENGRTRG